jgi:hypothetical protein
VLEHLVTELAAKRALSKAYEWEDEDYLNASVLEIRGFLTDALHGLRPGELPYRLVEQLRSDCNTFLTTVGRPRQGVSGLREHVTEALTRLRESFRVKLAFLAKEGQLPVAGELAAAIPDHMSPEGPIGRTIGKGYLPPPKAMPWEKQTGDEDSG